PRVSGASFVPTGAARACRLPRLATACLVSSRFHPRSVASPHGIIWGLIWGSIGGHLGAALPLRASAPPATRVVAVAKQENNPTSIGLTQYLDPSYWTWAAEDPNGAALLQQGAGPILAYVVQRLEAIGREVTEPYGIVHHEDEREVWSDTEKALVVEPKPDHLHAVIKFASRAKSAPLDRLAFGIGVERSEERRVGKECGARRARQG